MKKVSSVVMIAGGLFLLNIQRAPIADTAIITTAKSVELVKGSEYKVDVKKSTLGWTGTKPSGSHTGTINLSEGEIKVKENAIVGGGFVLDMTTITDTDLQGGGKSGLEGHLKGGDFFDVAKFATAKFEITSVSAVSADQKSLLVGATHNITGNLNLKGITKSVSFPAVVTFSDKKVNANADFNIDRTQWGIVYGADGKVAKEINLKLNLEANSDEMIKDENKASKKEKRREKRKEKKMKEKKMND